MRRREFVTLLGGAAAVALWLPKAFAQSPSKRPLIACMVGGSKTGTDRYFGGFLQGMRELGYAEGRDYGFEVRYADGDINRIPLLTEELLRLKPDVMVTGTMVGVVAAKKLTDCTPIVSESLTDPVGFGVAASHARPGGNVTGVLLSVEDMPTKLLALAIETVPGANRIGLLVNPNNPIHLVFRRSLDVAAKALGVELVASEAASHEDLQAVKTLGARKR
jgi:putative ABC transport system substrate-binding protein